MCIQKASLHTLFYTVILYSKLVKNEALMQECPASIIFSFKKYTVFSNKSLFQY